MTIQAQYLHTNLIARDWQALARFYTEVFGCVPVPPERHYASADLDRLTGLERAVLRGVHLRLPGGTEDGPTLELFEFSPAREQSAPTVNRQGFAHIAFLVEDVPGARQAVLAAGGQAVGDIVTLRPSAELQLTVCYVTDPEGNILELQARTTTPQHAPG